MITQISIKNYKSIVDLTLKLGRFNILIGENGCGKSNILEALTLGSAAHSGSLDKTYLETKGIRITTPKFMLPAFDDVDAVNIELGIKENDGTECSHVLTYKSDVKPASWVDISSTFPLSILKQLTNKEKIEDETRKQIERLILEFENQKIPLNSRLCAKSNKIEDGFQVSFTKSIEWQRFLTYSLDEYELRSYTQPGETVLGIHGRGLFSFLKEMASRDNGIELLKEICDGLKLLDWFDDMSVPQDQLSTENNVFIRDRFINDTMSAFDQRSTNEGFLYLLFYLTLVVSDEAPMFFAIDNIDSSFNPKLCREVILMLIRLAKKHNKQIIATTHNPAVLDGLDLQDEEQKLMVVQRSIDGYTKVRTIKPSEVLQSELSLSQLWLRGFIGGLPNNF